MKTFFLKKLNKEQRKKLVQRPAIKIERIMPAVKSILKDIKRRGDAAVLEYTQKFDRVKPKCLKSDFKHLTGVSEDVKAALMQAAGNITKFHQAQLMCKTRYCTFRNKSIITMPGIKCWQEVRPIERVGLYIPKGLVSTVLMLGIPARIAGCKQVVMCTPPDKYGRLSPEMLLAAKIANINQVFKVGGAQAIAAMAYGTKTIPKADKIFGPGNQYVTTAKMLVSIDPEGAAIDLPAGPSEVLVIADKHARPDFVAADLLSQAEHGPDSQVVLVTTSQNLATNVKKEIQRFLTDNTFRTTVQNVLSGGWREIVRKSLKNSLIIIVDSLSRAIEFSNEYSPEHLILNFKNPEKYISKVQNAGSVFAGEWSAEAIGDYASGTNHVLPTSGWAKSYSGISVSDFQKKISFQKVSKAGLKNISRTVEVLADVENLGAHKNAVKIRNL